MARNMSFAMTKEQVIDQSKTVTRRNGWWFLKEGDILNAVEKSMGLKKGEKIKILAKIQVVNIRSEPLFKITPEDVNAEGFPEMSTFDFIDLFKGIYKIDADKIINRIEFKYL